MSITRRSVEQHVGDGEDDHSSPQVHIDDIDDKFAIQDSFHKKRETEKPLIASMLKKLSPKRLGPFLNWQSRYCVLMSVCGHFRYYKNQDVFDKNKEPSGIIPLNSVSEIKQESAVKFQLIVSGGRVFTFSSKSPELVSQWVTKLESCLGAMSIPVDIDVTTGKKFWKPKKFAEAVVDTVSYLAETPFSHFMSVSELRAFSTYFELSKEKTGVSLIYNAPHRNCPANMVRHNSMSSKRSPGWLGNETQLNIQHRSSLQSKPCSKFILIIEGRVSIYSGAKRLCIKEAGEFIPMVNAVDRPLLCKCVTDCVLISMSQEGLMKYFQDHPKHKDLVNRFMGRTQVEELTRLSLFKGVPQDELYLVQCLLGWRVLLPGEVLFREGSLCASLYIVITGRCSAHAFGDGREEEPPEDEEKQQPPGRRFTRVLSNLVGRATKPKSPSSSSSSSSSSASRQSVLSKDPDKQVWSASTRERRFVSVAHNNSTQQTEEHHASSEQPSSSSSSATTTTSDAAAATVSDAADSQLGRKLHVFRGGDFFGEVSVMINMPRTVSIASESVSVLYELTKSDFETFTSFYPLDSHLHEFAQQSVASHFMKYDIPFFNSIPRSKFGLLAKLSKVQEYQGGKTIFEQGDTGDSFYLIAHGKVGCYIKPEHDPDLPAIERKVATLAQGKYFGELALVRDAPRSATIRCLCRCVLLVITRENFRKFFAEEPHALADFEMKVSADNISLRTLLYHPVGFKYFHRHCQSEYSTENINFWAECDEFKRLTYSSVLEAEKMRTGSQYRLLNWRKELKELADAFNLQQQDNHDQKQTSALMQERTKRMIEYDYTLCRSNNTSDEDFSLLLDWYKQKFKDVSYAHMERLERFLTEGRTMNAFESSLDDQSGQEQLLAGGDGLQAGGITDQERKQNHLSCFWLLCALRDEAAAKEAATQDIQEAAVEEEEEENEEEHKASETNDVLTSADIHRGIVELCEVDKWSAAMIEEGMLQLERKKKDNNKDEPQQDNDNEDNMEITAAVWSCEQFCEHLSNATAEDAEHLWIRTLGLMCQNGRVAYHHELYERLARIREDGRLYVTINDLCVELNKSVEEKLATVQTAIANQHKPTASSSSLAPVHPLGGAPKVHEEKNESKFRHHRTNASISVAQKVSALGALGDESLLNDLKSRFEDQGMLHVWNRLEGLTYCEHMMFLIRDNLRSGKFRWFLSNKARSIYETYISSNAPNMVNIKSSQKKALDDLFSSSVVMVDDAAPRLRATDPLKKMDVKELLVLYDASQHEILKLMERDTLKRFKHSPAFNKFKKEAKVGEYEQNSLEMVEARLEQQRQLMPPVRSLATLSMKIRSIS